MGSTLLSAICLPFIGRLVDVLPEHRMIEFVLPALAIAMLIAAYAPTIAVLVIGIFLLRLLGQGMMTHIALTATGRWFDAQRGRAVSLVVLGHQAGEASLPIIFVSLADEFGFQIGWLSCSIVLLLVGFPLARWAYGKARQPIHIDAKPDSKSETPVRHWTRLEVLCDPMFWILLSGVLAPAFIGTVIFFHQDYLIELRDWDARWFAGSLTLMAATTVVFALITGALIDRFKSTSILPFFLIPLAAACYVLSIEGSHTILYSSMFLLGISYGMSSTLFGALWPEIYGTLHLGAIRSIIVAIMVFATAAGPGLTGTMIDFGYALPIQLKVMCYYCLCAAVVMGSAAFTLRQRTNTVEEQTQTAENE